MKQQRDAAVRNRTVQPAPQKIAQPRISPLSVRGQTNYAGHTTPHPTGVPLPGIDRLGIEFHPAPEQKIDDIPAVELGKLRKAGSQFFRRGRRLEVAILERVDNRWPTPAAPSAGTTVG